MYQQLFKTILIIASVASTPVALADSFEVLQDGPYHILLPQTPRLSISRGSASPVPDCTALNTEMQRWQRGIKRCSNGAAQPETYCKLLREDLRRTLKGIINEPFGRYEPAATQTWQMDYQATQPSNADLDYYSKNNGLSISRVKAASSKLTRLSKVNLRLSKGSYTKMLEGADMLQWIPHYSESVDQHGNIIVTTKDKLTACELLSGKIRLQATAESELSYQIAKDVAAGDARWQLHQNLSEAASMAAGDSRLISLITGYYAGRYLSETSSEPPSDNFLMAFANVHLKITADQSKVRNFENKFQLFELLPQLKITKDDFISVEGEVENALD